MIDISKWAFENKKLIYFLIAVLIAGGAYSSYEMSKLEDPEITVKPCQKVRRPSRQKTFRRHYRNHLSR